jgi:hypothetical protein
MAILLPEPPLPEQVAFDPILKSLSEPVAAKIPNEVDWVPLVVAPLPIEIQEGPLAVVLLPKETEFTPVPVVPDPKVIAVDAGVAFVDPEPWRLIPPVKSMKVDTIISC